MITLTVVGYLSIQNRKSDQKNEPYLLDNTCDKILSEITAQLNPGRGRTRTVMKLNQPVSYIKSGTTFYPD